MSVSTMKSEAVDGKNEGRQFRRKVSKNSSVVNGAEDYEDESVVRQINLAAAFHDHLSCTKSSAAELCKIDYGCSSALPLPDHIYANCSGVEVFKNNRITIAGQTTKATELAVENKRLRNLLFLQLELIKEMEEDIFVKDRRIRNYKQESDSLKAHLDRKERMCLLRKNLKLGESDTKPNVSEVKSELDSTTAIPSMTTVNVTSPLVANEHKCTVPSLNLVTRYFGRRSKTIPSRALKRRYLGPPKTVPSKPSIPKSVTSTISISSGSEVQGNDSLPKPEIPRESKPSRGKTSFIEVKKTNRKRRKRPKGIIPQEEDFLTTDKPYFLPDNQTPRRSSPVYSEILIDVPSWTLKPVTSFYQMEGTENLNDPVFQRRHLKFEQDERRRKRWDIQRLREQKASEKLKYKNCRDAGKDSENNLQQKPESFYPDPHRIQFIEVCDAIPVSAFGHLIPLFQPSEFSISWICDESRNKEPTQICPKMVKKTRLSSSGQKIT